MCLVISIIGLRGWIDMCGRFALNENPLKFAEYFYLSGNPELSPSWNIAPSSRICTITGDKEGRRHLHKMKWGLIPSWAKDAAIGNKMANARGETVAEKPSFRTAFKRWRCLVPASGFYEWKAVAGKKQPYYIRPKDDELFGLAGITELWNGPDGPLHTVSLITTEPNELMRDIHDRVPVIVPPTDDGAWLDPGNQDVAALKRFIASYPADRMKVYPVSKAVSYAKNEG